MVPTPGGALDLAPDGLLAPESEGALDPASELDPALEEAPAPEPEAPGGSMTGRGTSNPLVVAGVTAGVVGTLMVWGSQAWWDEGLRPFHFRHTGYFGRDTYAGGSDKAGHFYATYMLVHAVSPVYEALGMPRGKAAIWAAAGVFVVSNWIELIDGFTDFGFETEDVVANTLGSALGLLTVLYPQVDRVVGARIAYAPSRDFLANDKTVLKWINDYTGMLFTLDLKLEGVFAALGRDPGLLRYVILGPVYGTRDYSPIRRVESQRRSLGFQIGLSLPEVLRSYGGEDAAVRTLARVFDFYAMPFLSIGVMKDLNSGDWLLNFGVANRFEIGL